MNPDDALWEQRFDELERYVRTYGNARMSKEDGIHSELRRWLGTQERKALAETLSGERASRLEALGVELLTREERWQRRFAELRQFKERFGHTRVAGKRMENPQLGNWVHAQRCAQRRGQLAPERIRQLDSLGFRWIPPSPIVPIGERWEEMFAHLVRYRQQHGDTEVPKHFSAVADLARWVRQQRHSQARGQMRADRHARLEEIGFRWKLGKGYQPGRWERSFAQLLQFRERFGHTRVPAKWKENVPLGHWVNVQRQFKKKGILSAERIARLEAIGFDWELRSEQYPKEEYWQRMCAHLVQFMQEHGHARVPRAHVAAPGLRQWAIRQRGLDRRGSLRAGHREKLVAIGFPWGNAPASFEDRWDRRFTQLLEYRRRFGHCRVPAKWKEDVPFGQWVHMQRAFKKDGTLSEERIARLEAVGFEWACPRSRAYLYDEHWAGMFSRLLAWQKEHGHTEVPSTWHDRSLATWVAGQRDHWKHGTLQPERRRKLEAIGFAWRGTRRDDAQRWERRYRQLLAFRQRFGHCRVPAKWKEDVPFGHWVDVQRQFRKRGTLSAERIARLDATGFEWHLRRGWRAGPAPAPGQ